MGAGIWKGFVGGRQHKKSWENTGLNEPYDCVHLLKFLNSVCTTIMPRIQKCLIFVHTLCLRRKDLYILGKSPIKTVKNYKYHCV